MSRFEGFTAEELEAVRREAEGILRDLDAHKGNGGQGSEKDARLASLLSNLVGMDEFIEQGLAEPPKAIVPRFVYESRLSVLAGIGKTGKSTLANAMMAAVSAGSDFLGEPVEQGNVLGIILDEPLNDTVRRLELRFGADPSRIKLTNRLETGSVESVLWSVENLVEVVDPALVYIESLAELIFAAGIRSAWEATGMTALVGGLAAILHDLPKSGGLVNHHARKSDGKPRDSSAIEASADGVYEFHEKPNQSRLIQRRARWAIDEFTVRLLGDVSENAETPLKYEIGSGELSLDARVLQFIQNNPGSSQRAVERGVTGSGPEIRRSVAQLMERGAVVDHGDPGSSRRLHAGNGRQEVDDDPLPF